MFNRRITKMDKTTGLKVPFMSPIPELGEVVSLDIYADEFIDGINKKIPFLII